MGEAKQKAAFAAKQAEKRKTLLIRIFKSIVNLISMPFILFLIMPIMLGLKVNKFVWEDIV